MKLSYLLPIAAAISPTTHHKKIPTHMTLNKNENVTFTSSDDTASFTDAGSYFIHGDVNDEGFRFVDGIGVYVVGRENKLFDVV